MARHRAEKLTDQLAMNVILCVYHPLVLALWLMNKTLCGDERGGMSLGR